MDGTSEIVSNYVFPTTLVNCFYSLVLTKGWLGREAIDRRRYLQSVLMLHWIQKWLEFPQGSNTCWLQCINCSVWFSGTVRVYPGRQIRSFSSCTKYYFVSVAKLWAVSGTTRSFAYNALYVRGRMIQIKSASRFIKHVTVVAMCFNRCMMEQHTRAFSMQKGSEDLISSSNCR